MLPVRSTLDTVRPTETADARRGLGCATNTARDRHIAHSGAVRPPAALLARTLGITVAVAATWQHASAGDWTTYAADIATRTEPSTEGIRQFHCPTSPQRDVTYHEDRSRIRTGNAPQVMATLGNTAISLLRVAAEVVIGTAHGLSWVRARVAAAGWQRAAGRQRPVRCDQDRMKASRSGLRTSAWVVNMPCGKPG